MDIRSLPRMASALIGLAAFAYSAHSATVAVDSGSYTTTFPGTDIAGRNGVPGGTPQLSGAAVGRPVPTNDWWSALLKNNHVGNLFNYPMAMRTLPTGLSVGLVEPVSGVNGSSEPLSDINPVIVGVSGLSATRATVDDYSDWTVKIAWDSGGHAFRTTMGLAMPFLYFSKASGDVASVTVNVGNATISGEVLLITNSQDGANFAVYAPAGSTWSVSGNTYTSSLNGRNYWSMAFLDEGTPATVAEAWKAYAYVEPVDTRVSWNYDEALATLRTEYTTTVEVHEGGGTTILQGLLPHQWAHLAADAPSLTGTSLSSIRGELKLLASNTFATERTFSGILPTLPALGALSPGFDPAKLHNKISVMENETLATWTDSYNEGQVMNRLIQTARAAHETGDTIARDKMIATIKERLEDWLSYQTGEVAFLFHYQPTWTALIGYPAGHGQDTNLNDHHFHWGYFIHAAAFVEQFEPGWADQWGGMVDLLVRDAASPDRSDPLFPFLRSFSPFAGHAWANGFATFPFGNDQESSSESMQFNSALIHWGSVTGNTAIRDLGIYLYTTEHSAIEEYWLDVHDRTFKQGYGFSLASRIWGNGYDNQTFWTSDIAAAYGIELYPIHAGSFYLGHNIAYAESLWTEMTQKTGILNQAVNDNLWHDIYWQFLSFTDAAAAIDLYNANPGRNLKFGVSDAQTYYWLHSMNALGQLEAAVTADDPLAVAFRKDGEKTYVAHNYTDQPKTVTFSDGASLTVPPRSLATSLDLPFSGTISTPFEGAPAGNTIPIEIELEGDTSGVTAVELYDGPTWIGTILEPPYTFQTEPLGVGKHTFLARLYAGETFSYSNFATVNVGDRFPFNGIPLAIPGSFEAGSYDVFEGGLGQDVTYHDSSIGNNGDYRMNEYVDTSSDFAEGAVVGWIGDGEWLEYTVDVAQSGLYVMEFRYASGNQAGGGPLYLELDGRTASPELRVPYTGNWTTFRTATLNGVELRAGIHVLRLNFNGGELNIGEMTFTYAEPLGYTPPVADAGNDGTLLSPANTFNLDGTSSSHPSGGTLTYAWEQISGPAPVVLSDPASAQPQASGMEVDGLYRFRLTVSDGTHEDFDDVEILRGLLTERPPTVAIIGPAPDTMGIAGQPVSINVSANDPDGEVVRVDLFNGNLHLASLTESPFSYTWFPPEGAHNLVAVATDSDGMSTTSSPLAYTSNPGQPCNRASESGDFNYEFGYNGDKPTVTFLPSRPGVGSNLVIFYHGVGGGPYPGVPITPGEPYVLNASDGDTIGFYFTYSVPEGGERNTIAENMTYTIGTCAEPVETDPAVALSNWRTEHFTPEELGNAGLEDSLWGDFADPDQDGLPNGLEFASGTDPLAVSASPVFWHAYPDSGDYRVRFTRRGGLPQSFAWLEQSNNLTDWTSDGVQMSTVSTENGIELIEAGIGSDSNVSLFIRLRTAP